MSQSEIDLYAYVVLFKNKWKLVVIFTLLFGALSAFFSLRQTPIYEAKTTILMRSGGSGGSLSQVSGLASVLGINVGRGGSSADDIIGLMKSRVVAEKVLEDMALTKRIKGWDDPKIDRQSLISAVGGMLLPTGTFGSILEIKTAANDPQLAADLADGFVAAVGYYWNELNFTEAQNKLKYIDKELPRLKDDLSLVEDKVKMAPGTALSFQGSVQRDYEIYNSVYMMMRKEQESTKLEAAKELPPFAVIDKAVKPTVPSRPKTKLNVTIGLMTGLFFGIFVVVMQEYFSVSGRKS
ncbi:MAG: Wzz/FepE/Etk N-terminal domain-containing protein [Candidatus Margulisiibacteriota bacterium]